VNQSIRNRLLAGTLALFAARLILSLIRSGPVLVADEMGYLGNARAIVGDLGAQMEMAPFYRGGYSLLIAPLVAAGSSPTFTYHLVLVLNAALAASVFPLLYLLLTRFGRVAPGVAIWAALAGAVYPAITVLSQVAMSENALFPLVCLWLIAFAGLLEADDWRRQLTWALGLGAATGALWAVHNRMIVAVALALLGLAWLAYKRRLRPAAAALALLVIALAFLGTHLLDDFIVDHNYGGTASDEFSSRMDQLSQFSGLRTALANFFGQTWYLLVATFGLAAATLLDFVGRVRKPEDVEFVREGRTKATSRRDLPVVGLLLALTVLLLLISAAAFPERNRPDQLIYGRYAEVVAPALIAFGVAALARARFPRRLTWPLVGFVLLTGLVALIRATASDPDAPNRWNISALPFVTMQLGAGVLIGAAMIAAAGAWLLLRAARLGVRPLGAVALALLLAVVAYGAWNPVRSSERAVYPSGWTSPEGPAEAAGARRVAYDLDSYDTIGLYVPQWFLPDSRISFFHAGREAPPAPFVISGAAYGREQPGGSDAEEVWSAAGRDQVLWRLTKRQAE
jgi:4-amino-4-deoxy-L-arabinose transferase-like glycosyltransferase